MNFKKIFVFIFVLFTFTITIAKLKKIITLSIPNMIYIPEGEFVMGTNDGFVYEAPEQKIYLKAFFIDRTEVTNRQYKRFVDATKYPPPKHWKNNTYPKNMDNYPVVNVSLEDALAYCKWAGKRLPTEQEWEKAARAGDKRTFPWGNEWEINITNKSIFLGIGKIKPVGNYQSDKSIYDVYDLAGNVREWTQSKFLPYPGYTGDMKYFKEELYVVRGGSYKLPKLFCRTYRRDAFKKDTKLPDLGFRCAIDK